MSLISLGQFGNRSYNFVIQKIALGYSEKWEYAILFADVANSSTSKSHID